MPPFRMPFTSRRPAVASESNDENARPSSKDSHATNPYKEKPSLALGIKEKQEEPNEFKLSCMRSIPCPSFATEANACLSR